MNKKEADRMDKFDIRLGNVEQGVEKIITNDLPHIQGAIQFIRGKVSILSPLVIGIAVGVALLVITVALNIAGVI